MTYNAFSALLPVAVGAIIGFIPALLLQKRLQAHELITRWDSALLATSVDLVEAARRTEHLADQVEKGLTDADHQRHYDEVHQQVRVSVEKIRLLGDAEVQIAARNVLRSVYSRRLVVRGEKDPHREDHGNMHPSDRLREHLFVFYKAVRQQLRVSNALEVPRDPTRGIYSETPS
jgi:hypothetical protein